MKNPTLSRRNARRHGGSAMVEFTLSLTFIVPVMLYAGYLTDALYDGLKAQEATAAAAWSFSGHLLHDYDNYNHIQKYSAASIAVRSEVSNLYRGLDPWAVAAKGQHPTELAGVSAKGTLLAGSVCDPDTTTQAGRGSGKIQDPSSPGQIPGLGSMLSTLSTDLHSGGLIRCQSQVEVTNWLFGHKTGQSSLLRSGSSPGNDGQIWPSNLLGSVELCGVGSAVNQSCQNTGQAFVMYTDDWGLGEDGNANNADSWSNYQDYNSTVNKHFANLGQLVYEQEAPVPYTAAVQAIEAAASLAFCSTEIPIDPINILDTQYDGTTAHDTFNLAERQGVAYTKGSSVPMDLARDDPSPDNSYEGGGITQPSYTWPVRHFAAGSIGANAYMQMEKARANTYLAQ